MTQCTEVFCSFAETLFFGDYFMDSVQEPSTSTKKYIRIEIEDQGPGITEADMKKGLELGADMYIFKPFSTRDLLNKVNIMALSTI